MPLPVKLSKPGRGQLVVGDAGGDEDAVGARACRRRRARRSAPRPRRAARSRPGSSAARRRAGAPGRSRGARGRSRTGPPGSRGSSRSGSTVPAWPPGASRSTITVFRPSRGAVHRGGEAGGAAADDREVVVVGRGRGGDAEPLGQLEHRRALEHRAVLEQRHRQALAARRRSTVSSSRASASRSTSSQRIGTRLRARKSRRSCESRLKRCPITRTPPDSSAAPASHVVSRSSTTGYSCSSGGSHGLSR